MSEVCPSCGARERERCGACGRALLCGSVSEICEREGCARRVLARRYESPSERTRQKAYVEEGIPG